MRLCLRLAVLLIATAFSTFSLAQTFPLDGSMPSILSCEGFFTDSGGTGSSYANNENFAATICAGAGGNSHIRLNFQSLDIGPDDNITIYDGSTDSDPEIDLSIFDLSNPFSVQATAANITGCLRIVFTSGTQSGGNDGWVASIECTIGCQTIIADLLSTMPDIMPVDTGYIDICPGERVEFTATGIYPQDGTTYSHSDGTSDFAWEFGDGNIAVGPEVTNVFNEPGGYTVRLTITDQQGCKSINQISQRVRVSTIPTFYSPSDLDNTLCSGDTINLSSGINLVETDNQVDATPNSGSFQQIGVVSDTLLLPDGRDLPPHMSTITFSQFDQGAVLTDVNDICGISLLMEHSFSGDLTTTITCPDGTEVTLFQDVGGATNFGLPFADGSIDAANRANDFTPGIPLLYTFVENNSQYGLMANNVAGDTTYTTVPSEVDGRSFTYSDSYWLPGTYTPSESFDALVGCPLNGEWTISIDDNLNRDNGWLFEWSMCFADRLYPDLEEFTPTFIDYGWDDNPTVFMSTQDSIAASPQNAGTAAYTFFVLDDFGCRNDTTFNFTILPTTHPDCFECDMQINEQEDVVLCEGETAALDLSAVNNNDECVTFESFPAIRYDRATAPNNNTFRNTISVNSLQPARLQDPSTQICEVCMHIATGFTEDLTVSLQSPQGDIITLARNNRGSGGYVNTCFTPQATIPISTGTAPYTGQFQPEGDWFNFTGNIINGDWTLIVRDQTIGPTETGAILQWSITFNSQNDYRYTWTPTTGLTGCTDCATPTADPTFPTTYEVLIEDAYGCSIMDTVQVGLATENVRPQVTCMEVDADIIFSWPPIPGVDAYEIRFDDGSGIPQWEGPYTDTEFIAADRRRGDVLTLEVRPLYGSGVSACDIPIGTATCVSTFCGLRAETNAVTAVSCFGLTDGEVDINITSGIPPYSIQIDNTGPVFSTTTIGGIAAGPHTYTITDALDCPLEIAFDVPTPDSLFVEIEQTLTGCFGQNDSRARAIFGGGVGTNYTFEWDDPLTQESIFVEDIPPGPLSVILRDSAGCSASDQVVIGQLDSISLQLSVERPTCEGFTDGTISVDAASGGVGMMLSDYNFSWSNGGNTSSIDNLTGDQVYELVVTDVQGCMQTRSVALENPVAVTFAFTEEQPDCNGFINGAVSLTDIRGPHAGDFTIQWDAAANNQMGPMATGLTAGTYMVTVEDTEGCMATETFTLTEPDAIAVEEQIVNNLCFEDKSGRIVVVPSGGSGTFTYTWGNGETSNSLNNMPAGDYSLTVTDGNGCTNEQVYTITEPELLTATPKATDMLCHDEENGMIEVAVEGGTGPYRFSIDNNTFFSNNRFIGLDEGTYRIEVVDANGCTFNTEATILNPPPFSVDAGMDETIQFGDSITLIGAPSNAQGAVSSFWTEPYTGILSCLECPNPIASPAYTVDIEIYMVDENGCDGFDLIRINVEKPRLASVPTGFTPNGDMANDLLVVHGRPGTSVVSFQVFDRWGEQVYVADNFDVNDVTIGWDGSYKGQIMNSGIYLWFLEVVHEDGASEVLRGQTTLIR